MTETVELPSWSIHIVLICISKIDIAEKMKLRTLLAKQTVCSLVVLINRILGWMYLKKPFHDFYGIQ